MGFFEVLEIFERRERETLTWIYPFNRSPEGDLLVRLVYIHFGRCLIVRTDNSVDILLRHFGVRLRIDWELQKRVYNFTTGDVFGIVRVELDREVDQMAVEAKRLIQMRMGTTHLHDGESITREHPQIMDRLEVRDGDMWQSLHFGMIVPATKYGSLSGSGDVQTMNTLDHRPADQRATGGDNEGKSRHLKWILPVI